MWILAEGWPQCNVLVKAFCQILWGKQFQLAILKGPVFVSWLNAANPEICWSLAGASKFVTRLPIQSASSWQGGKGATSARGTCQVFTFNVDSALEKRSPKSFERRAVKVPVANNRLKCCSSFSVRIWFGINSSVGRVYNSKQCICGTGHIFHSQACLVPHPMSLFCWGRVFRYCLAGRRDMGTFTCLRAQWPAQKGRHVHWGVATRDTSL